MDDFGNAEVTESPGKRLKTGGRKPGSRNKVTREIQELACKYTGKAVKLAWKITKESKEDSTRLAAIKLLLGYGHGKPTARQEIGGIEGGIPLAWRDIDNRELARRVALILGKHDPAPLEDSDISKEGRI